MVTDQVRAVLENIKERDFNRIFFIACGGSSALMYPSKYLVDREAKEMAGEVYNANEFIYRNPAALGKKSVVILCSQEGKTPETVAAAKFARDKGATTIAIAMTNETPLENEAEFFVKYGYYETAAPINTSYGVMYQLTAGILQQQEKDAYHDLFEGMLRNLDNLEAVVDRAMTQYDNMAKSFATDCKDDKVIYTLASGANYSQAYVFSNCYLMEMQWINSIPIHAGEFFHGPFEIIEKDKPVVVLLGLDATRPMEERALKFVNKYSDRVFALDAKTVDFSGVDEPFRRVFSPLVFNPVLRKFSKSIAEERDHSLDIRRYMHIVEY
jgi:fructoselysine 6-phosphate deglycase